MRFPRIKCPSRSYLHGFRTADRRCIGLLAVVLLLVYIMIISKKEYPQGHDHSNIRFRKVRGYRLFQRNRSKVGDILRSSKINQNSNLEKPVLITFINKDLLPFAYNWLCHTKHMRLHSQVVVVTSEEETSESLSRDWPDVKTFWIGNGMDTFTNDLATQTLIIYMNVWIVLAFLEQNTNLLLFEVDSFWYRNPLPRVLGYNQSFDIITLPVKNKSRQLDTDTGFIYLKPTNDTKAKISELVQNLYKEYEKAAEPSVNKKTYKVGKKRNKFSRLINHCDKILKCSFLSASEFVDGSWYALNEEQKIVVRPLVLQTNSITNMEVRIKTAMAHGHWFINKELKCNNEKVQLLAKSVNFNEFYQSTKNLTSIHELNAGSGITCLLTGFAITALFMVCMYGFLVMLFYRCSF